MRYYNQCVIAIMYIYAAVFQFHTSISSATRTLVIIILFLSILKGKKKNKQNKKSNKINN